MIVALGEALVDLYAHPAGVALAQASAFVPHAGGAPANVATVLGRLGIPARMVGAVGRDAHGTRLRAVLDAAGVDTRTLVTVPARTGITFVHVAPDGERSFLFYRVGGADYALARDMLMALDPHPLDGAAWMHVNASVLVTEPLAEAARWMLAQAASRGVRVSLDINLRAHLWSDSAAMTRAVTELAACAAWVKASEEDLAGLGLPATLDALGTLNPRAVAVLTQAGRGAVARVRDQDVACGAPAVTAVDATGAGDAFVAGVLACLTHKTATGRSVEALSAGDWHDALRWGCGLGARAVTALGATEALSDLAGWTP